MAAKRKRWHSLRAKLTGAIAVPTADGPRVWFHGVSVGEIHLLRVVLARLRQRRPDCGAVVSSTTDTGLDEARKSFPDLPVVAWPLDFSWAVRRAIREIRPDVIVLGESELWPGMLGAAQAADVPVVVINGRLSPKSFRTYSRVGPLARTLLSRVSRFAVQSADYAANLRSLGVPAERVVVTGSVKYDGVECDRDNPATAQLRQLFGIRPGQAVWVAGSTQSPEEQGVIDIYRRHRAEGLRLIIVPRQKDRFDGVAALLAASGLPFQRRTQLDQPAGPEDIILVDSIGELKAVWGLADIAFVGGSLDGQRGGQNMIEPAAYGAAVCFGPHAWNFKATVEQLLAAGGAIQVPDFAGLEAAVRRWLEPSARGPFGQAAREFVLSQQGATDRTLDVVESMLPMRAPSAA